MNIWQDMMTSLYKPLYFHGITAILLTNLCDLYLWNMWLGSKGSKSGQDIMTPPPPPPSSSLIHYFLLLTGRKTHNKGVSQLFRFSISMCFVFMEFFYFAHRLYVTFIWHQWPNSSRPIHSKCCYLFQTNVIHK